MSDPLLRHLELAADALDPCPQIPVGIAASFTHGTTRVLVAGELLTAAAARGLAGKLVRAADQADRITEANAA